MCCWKQTSGHPPLWGKRLCSKLAEPRVGEGNGHLCFLTHLCVDVEQQSTVIFLEKKQQRTNYFLHSATQLAVVAWSEGWSCAWALAEESFRCSMRRHAEAVWLNLKGRPPASRGHASNGTPPPGLRWGQHGTLTPCFPFPQLCVKLVLPYALSAPRRAVWVWGWGMWNVTRAGSWSEAVTHSPNRCPNRPAPCSPAPLSHQVTFNVPSISPSCVTVYPSVIEMAGLWWWCDPLLESIATNCITCSLCPRWELPGSSLYQLSAGAEGQLVQPLVLQ